jgi:hypothetical protein
MSRVDYNENFGLNQIAWSTYERSRTSNSSRNAQLDLVLPTPAGPLDASWSDQRRQAFSEQLRRADFRSISENYSLQVAVSSGDNTILTAWLACMSMQRSQVYNYFTNVSAEGATLHIRWNRQSDIADLERLPDYRLLAADIVFPDWAVPQWDGESPRCWKAASVSYGTPLERRDIDGLIGVENNCIVRLRFQTPDISFLLPLVATVQTINGQASEIYLPPRARYVYQSKTLMVDLETEPFWTPKRGKEKLQAVTKWTDEVRTLFNEGWEVEPDSLVNVVIKRTPTPYNSNWYARCSTPTLVGDKRRVKDAQYNNNTAFFRVVGSNEYTGGRRAVCKGSGAITIFRIIRVPA